MKAQALRGEEFAEPVQILRGEALSVRCGGPDDEDLRQIHDGVPRNRKRQLRLAFTGSFDAGHQQRASVKDGRERGQPRLVVVLRAEVSQHGIRQMTFHELRRPAFPIGEQLLQSVEAVRITVAAEQFSGSGRRAGTRVEERNVDLAPGKRLIDHR